jgi:3-hydroxyacyl-CoA dehydrogenase
MTASAPFAAAAILNGGTKLAGNEAATLRDHGDGLATFEIHRKMNSFVPPVLDVLEEALSRAGTGIRALVLASASPRAFSAGADLLHFARTIEDRDFAGLEAYIRRGQALLLAMKYGPVPVVAAVQGVALGAGCELMMHADMVVAHDEARIGLPEASVGVLPGWGGCTQTLLRAQERSLPGGPLAAAAGAFALLRGAFVSASAREAQARGILRPRDLCLADIDAVLPTAIAAARKLPEGYAAPPRALLAVTGRPGMLSLMSGNHAADGRVGELMANILTGGPDGDPARPATEEQLMGMECDAVVALCQTQETQARMAHFLKTLRN